MAGWASLKGRLFGELLRRASLALVRDCREDAVRRRAELVRDLLIEVRLERHPEEEERRARDLRGASRTAQRERAARGHPARTRAHGQALGLVDSSDDDEASGVVQLGTRVSPGTLPCS